MSRQDFCSCTPFEFAEIFRRWQQHQELLSRERWEQARFMAMAALQPHSKKALRPTDIASFEWDKNKAPQVPKGHGDMKRMRELEERCRLAETK